MSFHEDLVSARQAKRFFLDYWRAAREGELLSLKEVFYDRYRGC
jgi:hypothetical protein